MSSIMAQERRRHQGQKQTDSHFWVMVHMDLGDAEVGRFGLFQSCLRAAMGTPHASSHWNFPGSGETPEQLLAAPSEWRSVQCGHTPPKSMGYVHGAWRGPGPSWVEEEDHWRACGQPLDPAIHQEDDYGEVCMRHPGDKPEEDGIEGEEWAEMNDRYAPLTTKASELVYRIELCGAAGQPRAALRSAYQMQLQLRIDAARGMLVYDCYEFVPDRMFKDWPGPTERDLTTIQKGAESGLFGGGGGWDYGFEDQSDDSSDGAEDDEEDDSPPAAVPADEHANWFTKRLWHQFQHSRVYRMRIPLASVVGIRLGVETSFYSHFIY